jgi:hypothetical protein
MTLPTDQELNEFRRNSFHWQLANGLTIHGTRQPDDLMVGWRGRGFYIKTEKLEKPTPNIRRFIIDGVQYTINHWNEPPYDLTSEPDFNGLWKLFVMETNG